MTFEMFLADVRRMFLNARTYNSPETIYYKCSTRYDRSSHIRKIILDKDIHLLGILFVSGPQLKLLGCRLEAHFTNKAQASMQASIKIQP